MHTHSTSGLSELCSSASGSATGPGSGFHITKEGKAALYSLEQAQITRNEHMISHPLTRYFDSVAYGLEDQPKRKRKLHVVRAGAA